MRSKEDAHDYRYFPDPDLLPLRLEQKWIDEIANALPELPDEKRKRFETDYKLSRYDAGVIVSDQRKADYFEEVANGRDPKLAANWVTQELFSHLNRNDMELEDSKVKATQLGELIDLVSDSTISGKIAKTVFTMMMETGEDARLIVDREGMVQVTDHSVIEAAIDEVIAANPEQAAKVKEKPKAMGWFVGQVMKATGGKANPQTVNQILRQKLGVK